MSAPEDRPRMFDRPRRRTQLISGAAMVVLLGLALGSSAVAVNAFGVGDRFDHLIARVDRYLAGPPPDRPAPKHAARGRPRG